MSARFDISHAMIFKVEQHFMNGTYNVLSSMNTEELADPSSSPEDWSFFTSKVTFIF